MRGQAASKLLLGHAPVLGGCGTTLPKTDRRVTPKALLSRRIDGSGQSWTPPATTYSVFTANGSLGKGVSFWMIEALVTTLTLTREAFSWKPLVEGKGGVRSSPIRRKR